jgi:putative cardiolipin synthase
MQHKTTLVRAITLRSLLTLLVLLAAACTTLPPATSLDRPATHALANPRATPLGRSLVPLDAAHPGQSGFHLLSDGTQALQMRIALARAATKTLDLQYYIAEEDTTGRLLLAAALYAADRGVRVRMLVDDLNLDDNKRLMAALATHPSIEVRSAARGVASLHERRMCLRASTVSRAACTTRR